MSIIAEVLGSVAVKLGERVVEYFAHAGLPIPTQFHFKALVRTLREMPFIYKNLPLDALDDFVDISVDRVSSDTLARGSARRSDTASSYLKLREFRRLILVGSAGMGKTTLCRHTILALATNYSGRTILERNEGLVPFYVPLKAIDNFAPSPIFRFIVANYEYAKGRGGIGRLSRLARAGKLMLFLDGYDEIPYTSGASVIQDELNVILGDGKENELGRLRDSQFSEIYQAIWKCRIWLTSRQEFLLAFALDVSEKIPVVVVNSLFDQRKALVRKIFQRHRATGGAFLQERLDEELFMQRLHVVADESIVKMCEVPLFLTMICFTYVMDIVEDRDPELAWKHGEDVVLKKCLGLLVVDIDAYKARGLSEGARNALMNRRAAWRDEKLQLLKEIAGAAYKERKQLFGVSWLKDVAETFFRRNDVSKNSAEILRGMKANDPSLDLVQQLIFSGVFTRVSGNAGHEQYDFPHRRFREILACDYFNDADGCAYIRKNIADPEWSELIRVYVKRTSYWQEIVNELISQLSLQAEHGALISLLADCISTSPTSELGNSLALECVELAGNNLVRGVLPDRLYLNSLNSTEHESSILNELFLLSFAKGNNRGLLVSGPVYYKSNRAAAIDAITNCWKSIGSTQPIVWSLLYLSVRLDVHLIELAMKALWPSRSTDAFQTDDFKTFMKLAWRLQREEQSDEAIGLVSAYFGMNSARLLSRLKLKGQHEGTLLDQIDLAHSDVLWPWSASA